MKLVPKHHLQAHLCGIWVDTCISGGLSRRFISPCCVKRGLLLPAVHPLRGVTPQTLPDVTSQVWSKEHEDDSPGGQLSKTLRSNTGDQKTVRQKSITKTRWCTQLHSTGEWMRIKANRKQNYIHKLHTRNNATINAYSDDYFSEEWFQRDWQSSINFQRGNHE